MKYSKLWLSGLLLCAFLSACSGQEITVSNLSTHPAATQTIAQASSKATPKVSINFTTDSPPAWAKEAEAMMAELEQWRGKHFLHDLVVHIKPREDGEPAGWYNPESKKLVVTEDGSSTFKRGVMLHEIFHALQDQTFDLTQLHQSAQSEDADQAIDALIEGEAMLAVSDLMNYNFAAHAKLPVEGEISDGLFNRLFEYGNGMKFVSQLREAGGWEQVDQAFINPPQTTQDIYHPEQYLSQASSQSSHSGVDSGVGEYGFRLWLARDPEARSHLATLNNAYQSDQLDVSTTGLHTWTLDLDSKASATLVKTLAPNAIAKMPKAPQTYKIKQNKMQLTLQWQR